MRRWTRWAASAAGAAGAGAGIAIARHRRRPAPPAVPPAASRPAPAATPGPADPEAPVSPADDPQAALDAARRRLRRRADELRRDIESPGDAAGGA
jgi:type IV secretory pathway VirB10-like protein